MAQLNLPAEGGCRCGQVRFRVAAPPMLTMACHCVGCQKMTGGPYSLSAVIPSQGFEVLRGEPVVGGLHGADVHHFHCPYCMSWVFTKAEGMDWFVNIRATMLDDAAWFTPFVETCANERLPWVSTPATHSFDGFPAPDDYQRLTAAYANHQG